MVNSYRMGEDDRYDLALAASEFEPKAKEERNEPEDADISVGEW